MPNYRRVFVPGGSYFFTVNLLDRTSRLLVEQIDSLRDAVRDTKQRFPFEIDAMVILPDHIHAIWTLPQGDSKFSVRWRWIKIRFSKSIPKGEHLSTVREARASAASGSVDIGSTSFATSATWRTTSIIAGSIRSSMGMCRRSRIGRFRRSTGTIATRRNQEISRGSAPSMHWPTKTLGSENGNEDGWPIAQPRRNTPEVGYCALRASAREPTQLIEKPL